MLAGELLTARSQADLDCSTFLWALHLSPSDESRAYHAAIIFLKDLMVLSNADIAGRIEIQKVEGRACLVFNALGLSQIWDGGHLPDCGHNGLAPADGELRFHGTNDLWGFVMDDGIWNILRLAHWRPPKSLPLPLSIPEILKIATP